MTKVEKMMVDLQPDNPALADIIQRYNNVDSAYRAILDAIGQGKPGASSMTTSSSGVVIDASSIASMSTQATRRE